jgi:tetratricopeptide (TPR) repeat protein
MMSALATIAALAFPLVGALQPVAGPAGIVIAPQDKDTVLQDYVRARQYYHRGLDLFRKEKYEQAKGSFESALRILPSYAEAALDLGVCYYYTKKYETAVKIIEEAKTKYLQWHFIYTDVKRQEYDDAQDKIRELQNQKRELEGQKAVASGDQVARLNRDIAQVDKIIHSYQGVDQPIITEPVVPAKYYFHCGNCYLRMQRWSEAHQEFLKAIELDPGYGDAHNNLAYIYYLAKQYDNAW